VLSAKPVTHRGGLDLDTSAQVGIAPRIQPPMSLVHKTPYTEIGRVPGPKSFSERWPRRPGAELDRSR
jgi:hypothetical protein